MISLSRLPRRPLTFLLIILVLGAAAAAFAWGRRAEAPGGSAQKPTLLLLTALPLVFGETLSLDGGGSPALTALEERYRVEPIAVADAASLRRARLLLMAQPQAQPAEHLVALDRWVRDGGRLLLLADPRLEWPSELPLGDTRRPPYAFADTGLLAHWGLALTGPSEAGPGTRVVAGKSVQAVSPGRLHGRCDISSDRMVADCAIGRGRAIIVADADFLNLTAIDGPAEGNLPALMAALTELSR